MNLKQLRASQTLVILTELTDSEEINAQAIDLDIDCDDYRDLVDPKNPSEGYEVKWDDVKTAVIDEFIDQNFNDAHYNTVAMQYDYANNNYNDPEDYKHETIVRTSLINGQKKQAEEQCEQFGLCFSEQYHAYKISLGHYP